MVQELLKSAIPFNPHLAIDDVHNFFTTGNYIDEYRISIWSIIFVYEYVASIFNVLPHIFSSIKKPLFDLNKN